MKCIIMKSFICVTQPYFFNDFVCDLCSKIETLRGPADPRSDPGDGRRSTGELRHAIVRFTTVLYAWLSTALGHGERPHSRSRVLLK